MRFIEATSPRAAQGLTAQVYAQVKRDFRLLKNPAGDSPFLLHSPVPDLLAGFWSCLYETVMAEHRLPRVEKEAIAAAVSRANECPFCVDAHGLLWRLAGGEAQGDPGARAAWAEASGVRDTARAADRPFARDAIPEAVGTAVLFHYTNRMVNVFIGQGRMTPAPGPLRGPIEQLVGRMARGGVEWRHAPGRTLHLLPEAELPADLRWAEPSPHVAGALARFSAAVERAGAHHLPEAATARVRAIVGDWDGGEPPFGRAWLDEGLDGLDPVARPAARLMLLAALAPRRVDDATVTAFRSVRPGDDAALVTATGWSALAAARRIGGWLVEEPAAVGAARRG